MTIQVGDRMPKGGFGVMTSDGPAAITTEELFSGKKVVLFAVPGAFTPTCSVKHLPGFKEQAEAIRAKGVDTVGCMSVNDVFVMDAWGRDQGVGDTVMMLADGNGEYTKAMGVELDASGFGMGARCQRFAVIIDDGVVSTLDIEGPGQFGVSSADAIFEKL